MSMTDMKHIHESEKYHSPCSGETSELLLLTPDHETLL